MRTWDLAIALDGTSEVPVFLQIARSVTDAIRAGRLVPGAVLPGTRAMADRLKVHRNTVIAAYAELRAEGWIDTRPGGGTFVSQDLPEVSTSAPTRAILPRRVGFDLGPEPPGYWDVPPRTPDLIGLGGGEPDVRLIPVDALGRAHRRAMRARRGAALAYADPRGHPKLLEALARMLSSLRGVAARPETMLVTRGSQHALDLVTRALIRPGDLVAVEAFGYRPAWIAMQLAGARLLPIPVDRDGMVVEALAERAAKERIRAIYVTPHHQYPTMVTLSPARRLALLDLARERRFAIIEDDYDHEFHYDGRPVLPLASADRAGVVVYVGTMSKILAPGLRLGFVVAPTPLADRLVQLRLYVDRQGDQVMEAAVAELIEDGELARHVRRMRKVYGERRIALADALHAELPFLDFELPSGGIGLWARAEGVDVNRWRQRAHEGGVAFRVGQQFRFDASDEPFVRLGFAAHTPDELREGVRRMKRALAPSRASGRG